MFTTLCIKILPNSWVSICHSALGCWRTQLPCWIFCWDSRYGITLLTYDNLCLQLSAATLYEWCSVFFPILGFLEFLLVLPGRVSATEYLTSFYTPVTLQVHFVWVLAQQVFTPWDPCKSASTEMCNPQFLNSVFHTSWQELFFETKIYFQL